MMHTASISGDDRSFFNNRKNVLVFLGFVVEQLISSDPFHLLAYHSFYMSVSKQSYFFFTVVYLFYVL